METKAHFNTFIFYDFIQHLCVVCVHMLGKEGGRERKKEGEGGDQVPAESVVIPLSCHQHLLHHTCVYQLGVVVTLPHALVYQSHSKVNVDPDSQAVNCFQ